MGPFNVLQILSQNYMLENIKPKGSFNIVAMCLKGNTYSIVTDEDLSTRHGEIERASTVSYIMNQKGNTYYYHN